MQAHSRVIGYIQVRSLKIAVSNTSRIRMEPSTSASDKIFTSGVPLVIRYLRAQFNPYSPTCIQSAANRSVGMDWESQMQGSLDWSGRFSPKKDPSYRILREYSTLPPAVSTCQILVCTCIPSAGFYVLYTPVHA